MNVIKLFDISRPGQECFDLCTTPSRRSSEGVKGLLVDFNLFCSIVIPRHCLHHFATHWRKTPWRGHVFKNHCCYWCIVQWICLDRDKFGWEWRHSGFVGLNVIEWFQVSFVNDFYLVSTSRSHNEIHVRDVRNWSLLHTFHRDAYTNQRIQFSHSANTLISGDEHGHLHSWDLMTGDHQETSAAHQDVLCGVSCSQDYPNLLSTCSGQRHFKDVEAQEEVEEVARSKSGKEIEKDFSIKLWSRSWLRHHPCSPNLTTNSISRALSVKLHI